MPSNSRLILDTFYFILLWFLSQSVSCVYRVRGVVFRKIIISLHQISYHLPALSFSHQYLNTAVFYTFVKSCLLFPVAHQCDSVAGH
jgi:hypothetical protein